MVIAFYGFQQVPDVRVVTRDRGWHGWVDEWAAPLIEAGVTDHHLHNPFGLHKVDGRDDRVMHIDQFELSYCQNLRWLADREGFVEAVAAVHRRGGTAQAYVGSPLVVRQRPQDTFLPGCSPKAKALARELRCFALSVPAGYLYGVDACAGPASSAFTSGRCSTLKSTRSASTTLRTSTRVTAWIDSSGLSSTREWR